jgi:hypothetical protein
MRKEDTMTDDFQNVLRRVIAAQPKIYLSGHEGYYRHADIARLLRALTAWNTRPAPALDRDRIAVCISTHMSFGLGIDLPCVEVDKIADAILAMVGGGVPAGYKLVPVEPTEAMLRAWLAEEYRQCTGPTPDPAKCYAAMLSALEG